MSHSMWVRGLKWFFRLRCWRNWVALHVSAWIEMFPNVPLFSPNSIVALHVSAWIEIAKIWDALIAPISRTPCECVDWNYI